MVNVSICSAFTHIYTTIGACKCVFILPSSHFRLHVWSKISSRAPNSIAITAYIFLRIDLANPLPLYRSLFASIICFYDQKSSKKQQCGENATNGVHYEVLSANDRRNRLSAQRECQTAGRVAQRECQTAGRVAAMRPTGCC